MAKNEYDTDLADSEKDKKKLQPDEATLDLPDVEDIPGQENVHVPGLGDLADTTISSDDEEGIGLFNEVADKDLTNEKFGPSIELNENDLIVEDEELETEKYDENDEDDVAITSDSVSDESDVTPDELEALERTGNMDTHDDENLYRAKLDNEDFDGETLNEDISVSGKDLDVPGEEADDANEEIGEEDEENNEYSLGDNE